MSTTNPESTVNKKPRENPAVISLLTAIRASIYSAGFIAVWGWIAIGVRQYDSRFSGELPGWVVAPGAAAMMMGGVFALSSIVTFVIRGSGTPAPFDAPRKFVASGPYRYVRNPMYIGGWLILAGYALYDQSPSVLIFSIVWLLLAHLLVIIYEEPHLTEQFGESYVAYKKSVFRWVPRFPSEEKRNSDR